MFSIPAKLYGKFRHRLVLPILALTLLCAIPLARLQFESGFVILLPEDDPYRQQVRQIRNTFGTGELIMLAYDVPQLFRRIDLEQLAAITALVSNVPGTAQVVSLTTMVDLFLEDGTLIQRPIYDSLGDPELQEFTRRVLETPLFREFFVSADGRALLAYAVPRDGVGRSEYAGNLVDALRGTQVRLFSDSVIEVYVTRAASRELVVLGIVALLVVFGIEVLISRSVLTGAVLAAVSAVPSVWTLALLSITGQAVSATTMMVPVIVLVLATSYGIHVYRYHSLRDGDMLDTLSHVARIVMSAALTTAVGFMSLLVTPSELLQRLGVMIIFGIVAALVSSLILFPPILDRLKIPEPKAKRRRRRRRTETPEEAEFRESIFSGITILQRESRRPVARLVTFGLLLVPFVVAMPFIRGGYNTRDAFRDGTLVDRTARYVETRSASNNQLEVSLSTREQYGLVWLETFEEIRGFARALEEDPAVTRVVSYVDFVEWMLSRLEGVTGPVSPESDVDVGEAMELLSGEGVEQIFDGLVDPEWRRARLLLHVTLPRISNADSVATVEALTGRIVSLAAELDSVEETSVIGLPVSNLQHMQYLARSQFISILTFMPILAVFLMIVFKSMGYALVTLLPTMVGVIVYFGTVSLAGFLHDPVHVFMVAALMGVSNDDALYLVIVFRDQIRLHPYATALANTVHRTGVAIIQTTLIIIAGLSVFLLSDLVLLSRAAIVASVALASATLTTLLVLPVVLKVSPRLLSVPSRGGGWRPAARALARRRPSGALPDENGAADATAGE